MSIFNASRDLHQRRYHSRPAAGDAARNGAGQVCSPSDIQEIAQGGIVHVCAGYVPPNQLDGLVSGACNARNQSNLVIFSIVVLHSTSLR